MSIKHSPGDAEARSGVMTVTSMATVAPFHGESSTSAGRVVGLPGGDASIRTVTPASSNKRARLSRTPW